MLPSNTKETPAQSGGEIMEEKKVTNFDDIQLGRKESNSNKIVADNIPVKIAIVGNVDSGKSTLCACLTKGLPDDGKGSARLRVFNYPHEASNGRTSSVAQEIMGWDANGVQQFADRFVQNKNKYWTEVVAKSAKLVSLIDLCGHEKYLKTTMLGMVGMVPDYAMIIVGANLGLSKMTKEHLGISLALKLPFFIVVTKTDMVDKVVLEKTLSDLKTLLRAPAVNRTPIVVKSDEEVVTVAGTLASDHICPIFTLSCVSSFNIDKLTRFMYLLKTRAKNDNRIGGVDDPAELDIHERFIVQGIGLVVSGVLTAGSLKIGQVLLCGPDKNKKFRPVTIKSIHVNRVPVDEAKAGMFCCCAIKSNNKKEELERDDFRKGMCLLDPVLSPSPNWEFEAQVVVLNHATLIKKGYQAVVHCGVIRQCVEVIFMDKEMLRSKDNAKVRFRFMNHPEFLKKDTTIILREGRTKILGLVTDVFAGSSDKTVKDEPPPANNNEVMEESGPKKN